MKKAIADKSECAAGNGKPHGAEQSPVAALGETGLNFGEAGVARPVVDELIVEAERACLSRMACPDVIGAADIKDLTAALKVLLDGEYKRKEQAESAKSGVEGGPGQPPWVKLMDDLLEKHKLFDED